MGALARIADASAVPSAIGGTAVLAGAIRLSNPHDVPSDVTIWQLTEGGDNSAGCSAATLTSDDWKELSALRGAKRSRAFRVRAFLRVALSAAVDDAVAPGAWRFARNIYGKPFLAGGQPTLEFSVSHAETATCVAISTRRRIGLDIAQSTVHDWYEVAEQFFTPAERRMINAARPEHRERAFLRVWTAKEAFAKLIGTGLALNAPANDCGFGTRLASWVAGSPCGNLQICLAYDDPIDRQALALGMKQTK